MENIGIQVQFDITIFKCILEEKWYNVAEVATYKKMYSVQVLDAMTRLPNGQIGPIMKLGLMCEKCYLHHINNKEGLNLKEPSKIIHSPQQPSFRVDGK